MLRKQWKVVFPRESQVAWAPLHHANWFQSQKKDSQVEVCVSKSLYNTLNSGSGGLALSIACYAISLDKELYSTLSLFTQVYK